MDSPATYVHWGFILISTSNLALMVAMVVIFVAALLLPFPGHGTDGDSDDGRD